ncbi:hypothetical protein [Mesorhizobium sp. GbtcB19]|uniref:hypothetical protein n=1 Tax=Mesorhizobium sp. GbtcB19 TaxID=2824764 RepID=UPI001C307BC6|nr:hypothetical protein [Mesorhizobium sp. GbtcB19]
MTAREETAQNLTGVWNGRYFYPRELAPVSFVATLFETASALTGTTHEPASPATSALRYATLEGRRDGRAVVFVKTYTNGGPNAQPIDYSGRLNGDATEIEGIWRIRGNWSGKFLMVRAPAKAVSVERKAAERV